MIIKVVVMGQGSDLLSQFLYCRSENTWCIKRNRSEKNVV